MINQKKFKQLNINPNRVRELIDGIEEKEFTIDEIKKEIHESTSTQ